MMIDNSLNDFAHRLRMRIASFTCIGSLIAISLLPISCQKSDPQTQIPRGVRTLGMERGSADETFNPAQSMGVFIGVERFAVDEQLTAVDYAVDDAVDLAHLFSLELDLVHPERVFLLLSGKPDKQGSQRRLEALEGKGARKSAASRSTLIALLERAKRSASREGVFVLSVATHGFNSDGDHYLMTEDACLDVVGDTGLRVGDLLTRIHQLPFHRQVIFLDACRANLVRDRGAPDPRTAMSRALLDAIAKAERQVILTAAREGGYAYGDPERRNGVFTAAILDGLRCHADTDERGFITPVTLAAFVSREVDEWTQKYSNMPSARPGIESRLGGAAAKMPLASCLRDSDIQPERIGSVQFMDVRSKIPLASEDGQLILRALHRGIEVGAAIAPAIIRDVDHKIPDTPETVDRLMDILFHPALTLDEKYANVVHDILDRFSIDVLLTGIFINDGEVIQVSPIRVSRFERGFRTEHLQFADMNELVDRSGGELRLTQRAEEEVQGAVQDILGVPLLFVSTFSLVDGMARALYNSENEKLIFDAIRRGMGAAVGSVPNIVVDSSRHMVPDSREVQERLLDILFNPHLTTRQKIIKSIDDLMAPYSVDLLLTAVINEADSMVQITFLGIARRSEMIIYRHLLYMHAGDLFVPSGEIASMTSNAQGDIEKMIVEVLKEGSLTSLSLRRKSGNTSDGGQKD